MYAFLLAIALFAVSPLASAHQCRELFKINRSSSNLYSAQLKQSGRIYTILENSSSASNFQAKVESVMRSRSASISQQDPRFQKMLDLTVSAIEAKTPQQALIVINGANHSGYLFEHLGVREDIAYLTPSLNELGPPPVLELLRETFSNSPRLSPAEIKEITRAITIALDNKRFDGALAHNFAIKEMDMSYVLEYPDRVPPVSDMYVELIALGATLRAVKEGVLPKEDLELVDPSIFILSDSHQAHSTSFIAELPSAAQLKKQGISEVTLYVEGFRNSRRNSLTPADLREAASYNMVQALLSGAQKLGGDHAKSILLQKWQNSGSLTAFKVAFDRDVVINPVLFRLSEWIQQQYIDQGIEVRIQGLEPQ